MTAREPWCDSPREFFSLKQIADAARRENWPTGRALEEARRFLRRRRRASDSQSVPRP